MLREGTLTELLSRRAAMLGAKPAYRVLGRHDEPPREFSYADVERNARGVAARLAAEAAPQARVLIISQDLARHVIGILGCAYAGLIAVTGIPPTPPRARLSGGRHAERLERLRGVIRNSGAAIGLAPAELIPGFRRATEDLGVIWISVEEAALHRPVEQTFAPRGSDLALIQYTSGSTGAAKGVRLTHGNILANARMALSTFAFTPEDQSVSWLPAYHDMGLMGAGLMPLMVGFTSTVLSPTQFSEAPLRWLSAISDYGATISWAPNFAYELCVDRSAEAAALGLDLARWRLAFNGAEPVTARTLQRFHDAFARMGFRPQASTPCYGLAEATLLVSSRRPAEEPRVLRAGSAALADGRLGQAQSESDRGFVELVSCGAPVDGIEVVIVDPSTGRPLGSGEVGEIWCRGDSVAEGYFDPPDGDITFAGYLPDGHGPYLRTGDLGGLYGGEIYFVARHRDLVIIRGVNHAPQDLERVSQESHPALRKGSVAVFQTTCEDRDQLVVAAEVSGNGDFDKVASAIRRAIFDEFALHVTQIALLRTGALPKTPSGKLQRKKCAELIEADRFDPVMEWRATPAAHRRHILDRLSLLPLPHSPDDVAAALRIILGCPDHVAETAFAASMVSDYGVDSLELISLSGLLRDHMGVDLKTYEIYEAATIRDLARTIWIEISQGRPALAPRQDPRLPRLDVLARMRTRAS